MARCSICGTLIKGGPQAAPDLGPEADPKAAPSDGVTSCPECRQDYHEACWNEIGGCATYGCKAAAQADKPQPPVVVGAGWGDEKDCPSCGQSIPSSRLVCRCGARFPWADPMTPKEYEEWLTGESSIRSTKSVLITLFLLSLVGVTAPLTGLIAVVYAHKRKHQLLGGDGTYLAMAYGSGALGVTYLIILGLLGLGL